MAHIQIGDISPRIQYTANGSVTTFAFPFPIFEDSDLLVYLDGALQSSGYAVSGAGESDGGSAVFASAPANGVIVTLGRSVPIARTTDFQDGGAFRAGVINEELDRLVCMVQQVQEQLDRTVARPATSTNTASLALPDPAAGRALKWNAAGDGLSNSDVDPDTLASAVTDAQAAQVAAEAARDDAQLSASDAAASAASIPDASTQEQAEAGTDNASYMTPLRTAQAISALANGSVETITAGENLADRDLIYQDVFNQRGGGATLWYKVDADATSPVRISPRVGIALAAISSGATGAAQVRAGRVDGFTGLTAGGVVWASPTAGGVTQTEPAVPSSGSQAASRLVGVAASTTEIDFTPETLTTFIVRSAAISAGSTVSVTHWTDSGARERVPHAYIATSLVGAISQATGTEVSDQTGGVAGAAFDGVTTQVRTACERSANNAMINVGKQYTGGKTVTGFVAYGSSDDGFVEGTTGSLDLKLYGSNAGFKTSGTLLHTETVTDSAGAVADARNAGEWTYEYFWIEFPASGNASYGTQVAEVQFYEPVASRDEPVRIGSATIDAAATDCVTVKFSDTSDSNQDTVTTFTNRTGATRDLIVEVTL